MTESSHQIEFSPNTDNSPNFTINARPLHSRNNPGEEARRFSERVTRDLKPDEQILIIGVGAGYLRCLMDLSPARFIIFVEPVPILRTFLTESGFRAEIERRGARFAGSTVEAVALATGRQTRVISHPRHKEWFPELHSEILTLLQKKSQTTDDLTSARFFRRWAYSFFHSLLSHRDLSFLINRDAPGPPVLFCGAAPTLFDDLSAIDPRLYFVVAADTALAPLLARGIRPDLLISIDSGYGTLYHLRAASRIADLRDIAVLSSTTAHPCLSQIFETRVFYRSTFPLDQLLGEGPAHGIPECINESRNTAGIALLAAEAIGASDFRLAGVSFLSSGSRTHVGGTGYTLFALERSSRLHPLESYRPAGYRDSLTARNAQSATALDQMRARMRVQLPGDRPGRLATQSIPSQVLRSFLLDSWDRIAWETLESQGVSIKEIALWKRRLTTA